MSERDSHRNTDTSCAGGVRFLKHGNDTETTMKFAKPTDWNFSRLLLDIARTVSDTELEKLNMLVLGNGLLETHEVQDIKTTIDLFTALRNKQHLNSKNLACLQLMLMKIKRKDLISKAIEYCEREEVGEMVRYCSASDEDLKDEHSYVSFYFEGRESSDCNTNFVNYFKTILSSLLFVPASHVIISGLEPMHHQAETGQGFDLGFIMVLMIPNIYVSVLEAMLENQKNLYDISLFGLTKVVFQDKMYILIEDSTAVTSRSCVMHFQLHNNLTHTQLLEREMKTEPLQAHPSVKQSITVGQVDNTINEKLLRLHQKSGMSVTLWKNFGSLNEQKSLPLLSQDELHKQCLHAKVTRLYPQLRYDHNKKMHGKE